MTDVVRLDNVTKRFGRQTALRRVSFAVPEGSVFALLGENGAGKTTAIRILLGLADADEGKTEVLGLPSATAGTEIRRRVGYVPEESDLYDWMRVDEIGWFAAGFYPEGYFERYQELIDGFHVPRDRKISALSKGMRAKVRLAIALGHDPELLILDEPTSGLDAIVRREFLESMVDRAATGRTVLLSSHQIHEVERVADHVAIIREGELIAVERLDAMKEDTRRLTLTVKDLTTPLPEFVGQGVADGRARPAGGRRDPRHERRRRGGLGRAPGGRGRRAAPGEPGGDFRGVHAAQRDRVRRRASATSR